MIFFDVAENWWWVKYEISSREKSWIRGFSTCCIQVLENLMIMSNSTRKSLWNFHLDFTQKFTQEIHAIILPNRAFRIKVSLTKNLQGKMKLIRYFIENIFSEKSLLFFREFADPMHPLAWKSRSFKHKILLRPSKISLYHVITSNLI